MSEEGWKDFQRRHGLVPDGIPGPATLAVVRRLEGYVEAELDEPRWVQIARSELGVHEIVGDAHSPRVLEYLATTSLGRWGRSRDETPWCSAFINWVFLRAGMEGTGSAAARSWLGWGEELLAPRLGAVTIFSRGQGAHVALYLGRTSDDDLTVLGGNQRGDARGGNVSIAPYPAKRLLGYRWPSADMLA